MFRIAFISAIISLSLFFGSCTDKIAPENIIPEDKFITILVDIHLADAMLNKTGIENKSEKYQASNYYTQVLASHDVTREQFDQSLAYYSEELEELNKMYEKVMSELSDREANLLKEE